MPVDKTPYKKSWLELLDTLKDEGIITEIEHNNYHEKLEPQSLIQEDLFFIIHAIWTLYKKVKK